MTSSTGFIGGPQIEEILVSIGIARSHGQVISIIKNCLHQEFEAVKIDFAQFVNLLKYACVHHFKHANSNLTANYLSDKTLFYENPKRKRGRSYELPKGSQERPGNSTQRNQGLVTIQTSKIGRTIEVK